MNTLKIKKITYLETFPVRSEVLRQGKPIETCYFDGDELPETRHFGMFFNDELVGVTSVFKSINENFGFENQFQLRGMAILYTYQGKGFGGLLLEEVIEYVKQNNAYILWFNAREKAVKFYESYNFTIYGEPFEINDIGTHFVMFMPFVG